MSRRTDWQADGYSDRQTDKQTDRQTDKQTDRWTKSKPIIPFGETGRGLNMQRI